MAKLNNNVFVAFLKECAARKDGFWMGATGQYTKNISETSWFIQQYSGEQKKMALYWLYNALRCWDCQGLVEGYINDMTGSRINMRARNNYATWCDPKGTGRIPDQYKLPGAAVFIHNESAGAITHTGFLTSPVIANEPSGDWYVVEARGVMFGVVTTRLNNRPWNRWGLMTKYFDYGADQKVLNIGDRELRRGMSGDDVRQLQEMLIAAGFSVGRWGADGDFGSGTEAGVEAFQASNGLAANGVADRNTVTALLNLVLHDGDPAQPEQPPQPEGNVAIQRGKTFIRTGPGTKFAKAGIAREGDRFSFAPYDGWIPVLVDGEVRWISAEYASMTGSR